MITGREFARMYSDYDDYGYEERLYSTGDYELDCLLEDAFVDGYAFAQREFAKKEDHSGRNAAIAGGATLAAAGAGLGGVKLADVIGKKRQAAGEELLADVYGNKEISAAEKLKVQQLKRRLAKGGEEEEAIEGYKRMMKEAKYKRDEALKKAATSKRKKAIRKEYKDAIADMKEGIVAERKKAEDLARGLDEKVREGATTGIKKYNRGRKEQEALQAVKRYWGKGAKQKAIMIGAPIAAAGLAAGTAGLASRRRD